MMRNERNRISLRLIDRRHRIQHLLLENFVKFKDKFDYPKSTGCRSGNVTHYAPQSPHVPLRNTDSICLGFAEALPFVFSENCTSGMHSTFPQSLHIKWG